MQPKSVAARIHFTKVYLARQRADAAEQVLIQAQRDMPEDPATYRLLPELYNTIGQTAKAIAQYDLLVKQHSNDLKL